MPKGVLSECTYDKIYQSIVRSYVFSVFSEYLQRAGVVRGPSPMAEVVEAGAQKDPEESTGGAGNPPPARSAPGDHAPYRVQGGFSSSH